MSQWSSTLRLPKSAFPARATILDQSKYLQRCSDDLYVWQRRHRPAQSKEFILHDGPPYANGDLHAGHALNKILKDIICRTQLAKGKRVNYVPGWDCHGLPIELKALERHGWKERGNVNPVAIRSAARDFAQKTVHQQMKGFKSWGVMGDWENHWKTMDKSFELNQLRIFRALAEKGLIYRRHKPVYWSPSSGTALAEAELEYREDHISTAALVKFPIMEHSPSKTSFPMVSSLHVVIWTTTPWTLPANQAIAVNNDMPYLIVDAKEHGHLLLAESRLSFVEELMGVQMEIVKTGIPGESIVGNRYQSSEFLGPNQQVSRSIVHADFVSADAGTGLVHCAPGHGMEDYDALQPLIKTGEVTVLAPVDENGCFTSDAGVKDSGLFAGKDVFVAGNEKVLEILDSSKLLLAKHKYKHKYPYDWRTKQPVLIRATAQWFADVSTIRRGVLDSLENVDFCPPTGKTRMTSFVETRSEWCISRQRAWGVPIPALHNKITGEAILTDVSINHIIKVIEERGIDAWWSDEADDPAWISPDLLSAEPQSSFHRGTDTMDVWFDSGTSWAQMWKNDQSNDIPVADVYIEGTDQHRGWFQSSLLTHNAFQKSMYPDRASVAPYRSLITHGFTLDAEGKKMSKSIGNVISPEEIISGMLKATAESVGNSNQKSPKKSKQSKQSLPLGVDALRLWVASSDFTKDVIVSETVIKTIHAALHKYRVTFKLLLGNLQDFNPKVSKVPYQSLSRVDQIALLHLHQCLGSVRSSLESYEFHKAISSINRWITSDISNFYIEAVKDILYCDALDGSGRRAVQTVLYHILCAMQEMLGPITPLLVEESWEHTPAGIKDSHEPALQRVWNPIPAEWYNETLLKAELPLLMSINTAVKAAQERARADKKMGSSLDSDVLLMLDQSMLDILLPGSSENEGHAIDPWGLNQLMVPKEGKHSNSARSPLADLLVVSNLSIQLTASSSSSSSSSAPATKDPFSSTSSSWAYHENIKNAHGHSIGVARVTEPSDTKCSRCWRYLVPPLASSSSPSSSQSPPQANASAETTTDGSDGSDGSTATEKPSELCARCEAVVDPLSPHN